MTTTANATLRGYHLSAISRPTGSTVTIRTPDYHIVAEYAIFVADPREAIREVVRQKGRDSLDQIPGYLTISDDLDAVNGQW